MGLWNGIGDWGLRLGIGVGDWGFGIWDGLDPSALDPFTLAVQKFRLDVFFLDLVPFVRSFSSLFFKSGPFYTNFLQPCFKDFSTLGWFVTGCIKIFSVFSY